MVPKLVAPSYHPTVLVYLVTLIAIGLVTAPAATPQRAPTFAADVAPILYAHCVTCHRPGQAATSALLSYEDVRARAAKIVEVTAARTMPPWHATQPDGFVPLRDDRRLSNSQMTTLRRWAEAGAPPGDLSRLPVPPSFPNVWRLGIPDLVLTLPRPVPVPAAGRPFIRNLILSIDLPIDRWITAIDFQPSTRDAMQLAAFFVRPADATVGAEDPLPGLSLAIDQAKSDRQSHPILEPLDASWGGFTRWVPGLTVRQLPESTALRLPSHSNLVVQLHLRPAAQAQSEDGRVGVYFSRVPPAREITGIQLPPASGYGMGIAIPPGGDRYFVRDTFELPTEVDAYAVRPQGRDLVRRMTLTARQPGGKVRGLLQVERWDPRWEDTYSFKSPLRLARGTILEAEIHFDNSAANPRLLAPPQRVVWGAGAGHEMAALTLLVAARTDAGTTTLGEAQRQHFRAQVIKALQ